MARRDIPPGFQYDPRTRGAFNPVLFSSKTDQHWTPDNLLVNVREFFSGDFFDPCPRGIAPFDGLAIRWRSDVFCNPPYGRVIGDWVVKALREYQCGNAYQIVLLLPAHTDTKWFQPLLAVYPICFVRGRLKFGDATTSAPFPSALVYIGTRTQRFREMFRGWGAIVNG